ncbi:carbamate kinase [Oenococcus oeni]|uniref:carbamate kinase n=1 Tax=Oenococcus oeni TaxID=1247 RepID=UPI0008F87233|nr:carbamate kinase [Oenococcus oeni]MDN6967849.1 carbamate kinase [Oenococcus sp. UCMA 17063]OIK85841.1 carbamate kinase [Oenococcus oeni]OIL08076.1 carbamate kinase [Oenococcus oeni]OIL12201.1 carbamate kinase [Oenococcus oeni]OIL37520.1 carbamate kinase [Oenococcus oeni]
MTKRKVLVALGGNAILSTDASAEAQQQALRDTAKYLLQFIKQGDQLIISHGNGPQVGNLLLQQAAGSTKTNPAMPIDTAVAMTQGSIGYWMEKAFGEELALAGIQKDVAAVITQVEVSGSDPAFENPSKPIGPFLSKTAVREAQKINPKYTYMEDAGRGYRRIVSSPKPINVKEYQVINTMVEAGIVPISVGGGGIPVVKHNNNWLGQEAVIDKDFASEKLAELVEADLLIILTAVDNIYINFNRPNQKKLESVSTSELKAYIEEGQFAKGSMLPKVQAAMAFVENRPNAKAVVTSLKNVENFLKYGDGTVILK